MPFSRPPANGAARVPITSAPSTSSARRKLQPWQPFLKALNATVAAWLAPQVAAVRAADPGRLITVGYNDPPLASLPANKPLDFITMHRFPPNASRANWTSISRWHRAASGVPRQTGAAHRVRLCHQRGRAGPGSRLRERHLAAMLRERAGRRRQVDAVGSAARPESTRAQLRLVRRERRAETERTGVAGAERAAGGQAPRGDVALSANTSGGVAYASRPRTRASAAGRAEPARMRSVGRVRAGARSSRIGSRRACSAFAPLPAR